MRIIAGEHRGRKLLAPEGDQTRPVTDRVKQSIFDIVAPRLDGAVVYDCFAGTGSFGLESLSRGAAAATFFETHKPTARRLLTNITTLKLNDRATVIHSDLFSMISVHRPKRRANVVFLDPPYKFLRERPTELRSLAQNLASHHLADDGVIVFRHDAEDEPSLGLPSIDVRTYGGMAVEFLAAPPGDTVTAP